MKVLITVPSLKLPGGVANYYRTLRAHLDTDKRYFEVGARPGESGLLAKARRFLNDFWRFHKELDAGAYDLVHLNPSLLMGSVVREGVLILIADWHRRPVVVFFRGWEDECERRIRRRWAWLFRWVYGRADTFIVLGEVFERRLRELGIEAPAFRETTTVGDEALVPVARDPGDGARVEVFYLSRLVAGKGLAESIKAFAWLQARYPDCALTIAGDGPEAEPARRLVDSLKLNNVYFIGYVSGDEKRAAFLDADIFLFPTFYGEGMPNAILEAMAYGLPVVTRAVGGVPDFFENERMGFMSEASEPEVFGEFLEALARDPVQREAIGNFNQAFAREHFAATRVAERLLDIYDQV